MHPYREVKELANKNCMVQDGFVEVYSHCRYCILVKKPTSTRQQTKNSVILDSIEDTIPISANTDKKLRILEYSLTFSDFAPIQPCISKLEGIVEVSSDDASKVKTIETLKCDKETLLIDKKD